MFESLRKRMSDKKIKNNDPFVRKNDLRQSTESFQEELEVEGKENCGEEKGGWETSKSIQMESVTSLGGKEERVREGNSFRKLVSEHVSKLQFQKFMAASHRGAFYSLKYLKGPSQKYLESKKLKLPEGKNSKKKFLLLDLDETLIHSVLPNQTFDVELKFQGQESIYFNIRPGCLDFLKRVSEFFSIYIFTASTIAYAEPIIKYLNRQKPLINGILSRTECMETRNGCFIKDLRIISNRQLKDIVIIDNLIHSFGLQIDNGIPIMDFTDDPNDKELQHVEKVLMELKNEEDVRPFLAKELGLRSLITVKYKDLLS